MKKTKSIPAIVTLLGCLVAVVVTYINGYGLEKMLKILLLVLFIFLFMGLIIKHLFEKYIPPIEEEPEETEDEGSFMEKTSENDEEIQNVGAPTGDEQGQQVPDNNENV
ncbi:MAG: hypothetical protein Q4D29_07355 [Lachnospiraceae bacterium]|nr:hypothetical protein [Lachnospiraceae bacterium]